MRKSNPLCPFCTETTTCFRHKDKNSPKEVKPKKAISKKSDKQKEIDKELKKLYPVFLAEKKFICEIQSPECTKTAVCVHHKKGRGINEVLDVETFMASCGACNGYVESHDAWAREKGFKLNIHSN